MLDDRDGRDDLVARMTSVMPDLLDDLERMIRCESPSSDLEAVARSADLVAGIGTARLGVAPEKIVIDGRTHLRWYLGASPEKDVPRVIVLGHHDTVWPTGTLERHPFVIDDGILRGPGCFDMLTGVAMAFHAIAALPELSGPDPGVGVTLLVTGDEELGSPSSQDLIEREAAGHRAAFVLEASADSGALKVGRKGVSLYEVEMTGRAAHAGLEPEKGLNATVEMAHQVAAVVAMADPQHGTTVTPTTARSGTTTNTVPAASTFSVDARATSAAEQDRVDAAMNALTSVTGATVSVHGGVNRPPLETSMSSALFEQASQIADELGLAPLRGVSVGGASDGNLTAGIGVPTLDGMGAVGGGAHAENEHVIVEEIPGRTALLVALMRAVLGQ